MTINNARAVLYVDGSAGRNDGSSHFIGFAAVQVDPKGRIRRVFAGSAVAADPDALFVSNLQGVVEKATNNVAELCAIRLALGRVPRANRARTSLVIHSDSEWAIKAVTGQYKVRENLALIDEIRGLILQFREISFTHVRGHAGDLGNEVAHAAAVRALKERETPRVTLWRHPCDGVGHPVPRSEVVYIGRPSTGMPWGFGNPFLIDSGPGGPGPAGGLARDGSRQDVIDKYRSWLLHGEAWAEIHAGTRGRKLVPDATEDRRQWILRNLDALRGKYLGCFCRPSECHGDVLLELLNLPAELVARAIRGQL